MVKKSIVNLYMEFYTVYLDKRLDINHHANVQRTITGITFYFIAFYLVSYLRASSLFVEKNGDSNAEKCFFCCIVTTLYMYMCVYKVIYT